MASSTSTVAEIFFTEVVIATSNPYSGLMKTARHSDGLYTEDTCELCYGKFASSSIVCEAYDPDDEIDGSVVAHLNCAQQREMEII